MNLKLFLALSALCTAILFSVNCGGGGDSVASVTIGGTGQGQTSKPVELTAPIDSFSSIVVGGIQFDIDQATTMIEGISGNTDSLQAGMWITISGNLSDDETLGTATDIAYESRLAGIITSATSNVITISGVNIIIQDDTQIDENVSTPLAVNDDIKVSGSYLDDDFLASFIGPNPTTLRIAKTKEDLQATLSTNTINILQIRLEQNTSGEIWSSGNLSFDFENLSSDNLIDPTAQNQTLARGQHVLVHADFVSDTTLKVYAYQVLTILDNTDQTVVTGTLIFKNSSDKTFILDTVTYKTNKFTRFSSKSKKNFGFKDLEVGETYEVNYVLDNNSERLARRVKRTGGMQSGPGP